MCEQYIPIANENYGFADTEQVANFDRMWKRPDRPRSIFDGYMLLLARPSGLAIYCSQEMRILRNFDVRAVYTHRKLERRIVSHAR